MTHPTDAAARRVPPAGDQLWLPGELPPLPPLAGDAECGVCIVGAGITGLAAALELAGRGHDVVVLEAEGLAAGETGRSTAHLVTALDERYMVLEKSAGPGRARAAAAAHAGAIRWFERMVAAHRIDAGFTRLPGVLVAPPGRGDSEGLLGAELAASSRAGVACERSTAWVFRGRPCLRYPGQAQVDPARLVAGFARAVAGLGGRLHGGCRVTALEEGPGGVTLHAGRHRLRASHAVLAAHGVPLGAERARRVRARRSYVAALELRDPPEPELAWDGYWDDHTPYHYVRGAMDPRTGRPVLLVGGEDEDAGLTPDVPAACARLAAWAHRELAVGGGVVSGWSGRILEPQGEFALIGPAPGLERTFLVSGDSGNGFTYAAIAAGRIAGLIEGGAANPMDEAMYRVSTWA